MNEARKYLYQLFILVFIVTIGWRVYVLGFSSVLSGAFSETKNDLIYQKSYALHESNLGALFKLAKSYHDKGKYKQSNNYLFKALLVDPSYGRASALMLSNFSSLEDDKRAFKSAYFSEKLWPAHSYVRMKLLSYWLKNNNNKKTLEEYNVLLIRNSSMRRSLYPIFDYWVKDEALRALFSPYLSSPPKWWDSYFRHLSRGKDNLSIVDYFYEGRLASSTPLSLIEIQLMTQRLMKEKLFRRAYEVWGSGLSPELKKYHKHVFDGGFESGFYNKPFSWRMIKSKIFSINVGSTYGVRGRKALHLKFKRKKSINFRHVYQKIMLPSDSYTLSLRYRVDSTVGEKGLVWRVRCLGKSRVVIAETEAFISRKSWSKLSISLDIPEKNCKVQELRLEAMSNMAHYQVFSGSMWFDDIQIKKREEQ